MRFAFRKEQSDNRDEDQANQSLEKYRFRQFIWELLDGSQIETKLEARVNYFLAGLILLNVVAVILESVSEIELKWRLAFQTLEFISVFIFSFEYLLRFWSAPEDSKYRHPILGRLRYCFTVPAIIDLISILPSILAMTTVDLRIVRGFRLFRLFRIFKLRRYQASWKSIQSVVGGKKESLIIALALMLGLLLTSSSLMYFAEGDIQPDKFSDIPSTFWWTIMTLTTVGYGDVYPVTALGKVIASMVATLGIAFFALPTAILAAGVVEHAQAERGECKCPHCGESLR